MAINIYHSFTCDVEGCESKDDRVYPYYKEMTTPTPSTPKGWTSIGRKHYCPDHEVVVSVRPKGEGGLVAEHDVTGRHL